MNEHRYNPSPILWLDGTSGISGDMTVGALLDLGIDFHSLEMAIASLRLEGARIACARTRKSGLDACDFRVELDEAHENHDHDMAYLHPDRYPAHGADASVFSQPESAADSSDHSDTQEPSDHHAHAHAHHGRSLGEIEAILARGELSENARRLAVRIFRIIAEAEARVHGRAIEEVHFHEVGAVDSIIDIASAAFCIDALGIERCVVTGLTEGTGTVRCQHGLLPVPVPAVTQILSACPMPLHIAETVQGELITPTGAAIAAALRTDEHLPTHFRIRKTGLGAGKRDYATAGVLRACLIEEAPDEAAIRPPAFAAAPTQPADRTETAAPAAAATSPSPMLVLETNIDDCSGEALGYTLEQLLAAGAADAYYTPVFMKKNRPGQLLTVVVRPELRGAMEDIIFRNTTTIGIRCHEVARTVLPREIRTVRTPWGEADIKCCRLGEDTYYYPESRSTAALAAANAIGFEEMYHRLRAFAAGALQEV